VSRSNSHFGMHRVRGCQLPLLWEGEALHRTREVAMPHPVGFDALKDILSQRIAQVPDHRKQGPNTQYTIHDAALGAFGIFFTPSASFLEYQRRLQHTQGRNQVRTLLDPLVPSHLDAVFLEVV